MPLSARTGALERDIRVVADSVRATVGVAVVFGEGDTLVVNNAHRYPTMSVYKFHQALALLDSLDRAGLPLTTRIPVLRSDLLSDTWSPLRDARPEGGYELTAAELLDYSVAQSDNNVCDLLFRFLGGPETVNCYIARLGVGRTAITKSPSFGGAFSGGYFNASTTFGSISGMACSSCAVKKLPSVS